MAERESIPYYPRVTIKFREAQKDKVQLMDIILRECRACKVPKRDIEKFRAQLEALGFDEMVAWAEARFVTVR